MPPKSKKMGSTGSMGSMGSIPSVTPSITGSTMQMMHSYVQMLNNSKMFAGVMIIILNVSSRFVNIKLGKTMESYLKHSFSKQLLVFTIAWMGTRDIYVSFIITFLFTLLNEYLLHEESAFCILSPDTCKYYIEKMETIDTASKEEIDKAKKVIGKAIQQGEITDIEKEFATFAPNSQKEKKPASSGYENTYNTTDFMKPF